MYHGLEAFFTTMLVLVSLGIITFSVYTIYKLWAGQR